MKHSRASLCHAKNDPRRYSTRRHPPAVRPKQAVPPVAVRNCSGQRWGEPLGNEPHVRKTETGMRLYFRRQPLHSNESAIARRYRSVGCIFWRFPHLQNGRMMRRWIPFHVRLIKKHAPPGWRPEPFPVSRLDLHFVRHWLGALLKQLTKKRILSEINSTWTLLHKKNMPFDWEALRKNRLGIQFKDHTSGWLLENTTQRIGF